MALERRVEVLFDPQEHERLQTQARTRGVSVGELVREAVRAQLLEADTRSRREAADVLTSGLLGLARLPDWRSVDDEIARSLRRDLETH